MSSASAWLNRLQMDVGSLGKYNGLKITYNNLKIRVPCISITQSDYVDKIAKRFGIQNFTDSKLSTPAPAEAKVSLNDCSEEVNTTSSTLVRTITSSAAYAQFTHPENRFPLSLISQLSRVIHKLQEKHVDDSFHIIQYLYNHCNAGITSRKDSWTQCAWHCMPLEYSCGARR